MARLTQEFTVGGRQIGGATTSSGATETSTAETVAAGKVGELTTRTDAETGTLTMESGHGITTGQIIDLYWADGIRRAVTVGTVSGDSVPIGGVGDGKGEDLPLVNTAVIACVRRIVDLDVAGDTVAMAGADVSAGRRCSIEFEQNDGTEILPIEIVASATEKGVWIMGATNDFAGESIGRVAISNGSSEGSATVQFGLVRDNVS